MDERPCSIPGRSDSSLLQSAQTASVVHPASSPMDTGSCFPEVKEAQEEPGYRSRYSDWLWAGRLRG
jgi:hypothetical protein